MSVFQEQPLPISVPTVADLATSRARTADGAVVTTTGHRTVGDNGGAPYVYHRTGRSLVTIGKVNIAGPGVDDYWSLLVVDECISSQFGTVADGTTNDRTALLDADAAATAEGGIAVTLTPGVYAVASNVTFANHVKFMDGARLKPASGVVITVSNGFTADAARHVFDISAGGSFVIQKASQLSAVNFGADPTGAVDSTTRLNAFFAAIAANDCGLAICNGTFATSGTVYVGATTGEGATKNVEGAMTINCSGAVDVAVYFRRNYYLMWKGLVRVNGAGGAVYTNRTVTTGVFFRGTNFSHFDGFYVQNMKGDGFVLDSTPGGNQFDNFTYSNNFGNITCTTCGSAALRDYDYLGVDGTWSNRVDTGSSGGFDQRSTIEVDNLPPVSTDSIKKTIWINDQPYDVISIDRNNSTVTVFPWIVPTLVPVFPASDPVDEALGGVYRWMYGSGVRTIGAEVAGNIIHHCSILSSGHGLSVESLYGPTFDLLQTQFCGSGMTVGDGYANAVYGCNIVRFYGETVNEAQFILKTGTAKAITIGSFAPAEAHKVHVIAAPIVGAWNAPSPTYNLLKGCSFNTELGFIEPNKPLGNSETLTGAAPLNVYINRDVTYYGDSFLVQIDPVETALVSQFGIDSFRFTVSGTGEQQQPTGTITVQPPPGWKINGGTVGANAAFTGFSGPTTFTGYLQLDTSSHLCTVDNSTDEIIHNDHGLSNGETVRFNAPFIPAGLLPFTVYYVVQRTTNRFKVSLTSGGSAVNITEATSKTIKYNRGMNIILGFSPPVNLALQRENHSGSQSSATISDFEIAVRELDNPTSYTQLLSQAVSVLNGDGNLDGTADANDVNGNYNGTWTGTPAYGTPATYKGKSFVLNGTAKFLTQASAAGNYTDDFTVSVWVRVNVMPSTGNSYRIVSKRTLAASAWEVYLTSSGEVGFNTGNNTYLTSAGTVGVGTWYHIAVVIDGASSNIYVDGQAARAAFTPSIFTNSEPVSWGRLPITTVDFPNGLDFFNGDLFQAAIWDTALTTGQVAELHNRSLATVSLVKDLGALGTGTLTYDFSDGNEKFQTARATGSIALAFTASVAGYYTAIVEIDTGTPPTITYSTTVVGTAPTIATADNAKTIIPLFYDGATWFHV